MERQQCLPALRDSELLGERDSLIVSVLNDSLDEKCHQRVRKLPRRHSLRAKPVLQKRPLRYVLLPSSFSTIAYINRLMLRTESPHREASSQLWHRPRYPAISQPLAHGEVSLALLLLNRHILILTYSKVAAIRSPPAPEEDT